MNKITVVFETKWSEEELKTYLNKIKNQVNDSHWHGGGCSEPIKSILVVPSDDDFNAYMAEAEKKWEKEMAPRLKAIRDSEKLTGDDFNTRIY